MFRIVPLALVVGSVSLVSSALRAQAPAAEAPPGIAEEQPAVVEEAVDVVTAAPAELSEEAPSKAAVEAPSEFPVEEPSEAAVEATAEPVEMVAVAAPPLADEPLLGHLDLTGTYLMSFSGLSKLRVDNDGDGIAAGNERYGQGELVQHRLRFEPVAALDQGLTIAADIQLLSGYLFADGPNPRLRPFGPPRSTRVAAFGERQVWRDQLALRQAFIDWRTPIGAVMVGRMVSQWGLGLLANGGEGDLQDWGGVRFGADRNFGDVVNRLLFATRPLALLLEEPWAARWTLALGADIVERDERIELSKGDFAWQAIAALRYAYEGQEAGVYVAYRELTDRRDDTLEVLAVDLFGKGSWRLAEIELSATGEVALVAGQTTLARNNAFTGQIEVDQLGYLARGGAKYLPWNVGLDVEVGYASGDSNPNDDKLRSFTFDPAYNPSLILFTELRAAETVAGAANASDPARVGYPPDSARLLPTGGAVQNAIYVRPTVRVGFDRFIGAELGALSLRLALLYAVAEEDLVDPFASTLAGGVAVNHQGGAGSERELGLELNAGLDYGLAVANWAELDLSLQYGRLYPGAAFDNGLGRAHPAIDAWFARLLVRWLPPPEARP